jgi:hypothetical protein
MPTHVKLINSKKNYNTKKLVKFSFLCSPTSFLSFQTNEFSSVNSRKIENYTSKIKKYTNKIRKYKYYFLGKYKLADQNVQK